MQVHAGIPVKDLQDKARLLIGKEIPDSPIHKSIQNRSLFQADRKDHILRNDDTQRHRAEPVLLISFFDDRNIYQDQGVIIFHLNTRSLFFIQRCPKIILINMIFVGCFQNFCSRGIGKHHPAALRRFIQLMNMPVYGPENLYHDSITPFDHPQNRQSIERFFMALLSPLYVFRPSLSITALIFFKRFKKP